MSAPIIVTTEAQLTALIARAVREEFARRDTQAPPEAFALSVKEAALRLGTTANTVRKYAAQGRLEYVDTGDRRKLVTAASVRAFTGTRRRVERLVSYGD